jgi:hypothetical protein
MALIANPNPISPKFHRHLDPLAPQSPSAGSLAHNQSSTIDGSRISPPSQLVFTASRAIAKPIPPAARFRRSITVVFTGCTNSRCDRASDTHYGP